MHLRFVGTWGDWLIFWDNQRKDYCAVRAAESDGVRAASISGIGEAICRYNEIEKANKEIGGVS